MSFNLIADKNIRCRVTVRLLNLLFHIWKFNLWTNLKMCLIGSIHRAMVVHHIHKARLDLTAKLCVVHFCGYWCDHASDDYKFLSMSWIWKYRLLIKKLYYYHFDKAANARANECLKMVSLLILEKWKVMFKF